MNLGKEEVGEALLGLGRKWETVEGKSNQNALHINMKSSNH